MKKGFIAIISTIVGTGIGAAGAIAVLNSNKTMNKGDKFKIYYNALNQWLKIKNSGKKLDEYFINNNYKTAAIYGMGELGNRLYEEIRESDIEIKYAIDQNAQYTYSDLRICSLDSNLEEVDVVIVTAVFAFEEIRSNLENKMGADIISLEDVIFEI